MALGYKGRKRLALLVLLVGLPVYVVLVVNLLDALPRLSLWLEVPLYLLVGLAWILPCKAVFLGIGQENPDQK
jgi:hypothetical protein